MIYPAPLPVIHNTFLLEHNGRQMEFPFTIYVILNLLLVITVTSTLIETNLHRDLLQLQTRE